MARDVVNCTPLHTAAMESVDYDVVTVLSVTGTDPSVQSEDAATPLRFAMMKENVGSLNRNLVCNWLADWTVTFYLASAIVATLTTACGVAVLRTVHR